MGWHHMGWEPAFFSDSEEFPRASLGSPLPGMCHATVISPLSERMIMDQLSFLSEEPLSISLASCGPQRRNGR